MLGAPHLDDIERPVHQVWLRSPSFRGLTEADMWLRLAEGLLPAYDQPKPSEATTDQPAATPAGVMALAGVRAWAEYEANTDADDAVICPQTQTLLALLEVREFFRCALTAIAICTGPLANQELLTVEQLAEAIAAIISQRINTPPELQHAQWLTDTVTVAGVEMYLHHNDPTLLRVGDDNLCAISLSKEDEGFADTLRLAVAFTSHVALLRAIRLRTIVIYLTESEFDPSELLIHPYLQPDDPGGGGTGRQHGAQADDEEELELTYEENDSAMEVDTTQGAAAETPATELLSQSSPASQPTIAANLASFIAESHQPRNPQRLFIKLERHPSQPTPTGKGKTAASTKIKKKQLRGRSRSDGATRNRSKSKPRPSGTRSLDSEWITYDDAAHPSNSSHQ
eukprot:jgi/Tetstr1/454874/TSEL_041738.t1